jgi:hypothetical protein
MEEPLERVIPFLYLFMFYPLLHFSFLFSVADVATLVASSGDVAVDSPSLRTL